MAERKYLRQLREDLQSGRFGPAAGALLPTIRELAGRYRCSVSSIRQAMEVLKTEGMLHAIAGKGTFSGPAPVPPPSERARMLAVVAGGTPFSLPPDVRAALAGRGWLVADCPEGFDEDAFLGLAQKNRFAGALVAARPAPELCGRFAAWRRRGMKFAHLWSGAEELPDESCFLCDVRTAGLLGVAAALKYECTQLAMMEGDTAGPEGSILRAAVRTAAAGMRLEIVREIVLPGWPGPGGTPWERNRRREESFPAALPGLAKLPRATGILCGDADVAFQLRKTLAARPELLRPGCCAVSLFNTADHAASEGGIHFDFEQQLAAALDYLTDDRIDAGRTVRQTFQPVVREVPAFLQLESLTAAPGNGDTIG